MTYVRWAKRALDRILRWNFVLFILAIMIFDQARAEPYQVPNHPAFTAKLPACVVKTVLLKDLKKFKHPISWVGTDDSHPAQLALFVNVENGTWFLVAIRTDSVLACVMARGNESRLVFGRPM